jgi:Ferritin-like domain
MPTQGLTRAALVRRGAGGGLALAVATTPLALLPAAAQGASGDGDLAYLRLLLGAELLAVDFSGQAQRKLPPRPARAFARIVQDEKRHLARLGDLLAAAGQTPATGGDIDFTYPAKTFSSAAAILRQGTRIEALLVGAYIGALASVTTPELRLPLAQIAANEAQHASTVAHWRGGAMIGPALAPALSIDAASTALDGYES